MINMSELICDPDFASTVVLERSGGGGYDNYGLPLPVNPANEEFLAITTRATAQELKIMGFGELIEEVRRFVIDVDVKLTRPVAKSDRFIRGGKRYKVIKIDDNAEYGFYRAYAVYEGKA